MFKFAFKKHAMNRRRQGEVVRALIKTFGLGESLERKDQMREAVEAVWGAPKRGSNSEKARVLDSDRPVGALRQNSGAL